METLFCRGRTDCAAFGVFIAIVLLVLFLNYIQKCIHKHRTSNSSSNSNSTLPISNQNSPNPPNTPLTEDNPVYQNALKSIPTSRFDPDSQNLENCAICLGEFEIGEIIRVLPKCSHVYHKDCIDQWLLRGLHCPICRMRVVDFQSNHLKILSSNNNNNTNNVQVRLNNHVSGATLVLI